MTVARVPVKNVKVTVEVENTTEQYVRELPLYPLLQWLEETKEGRYCLTNELPGYKMKEEFFGFEPSLVRPYYFNSAAATDKNSIFYTELKPCSVKTMQFWFAVPEDELEAGYLEFWKRYYVKIMW